MFGLVSTEFLFYMLILFFRIRAEQKPHAVSVLPRIQGSMQTVFQQRRRGSRLSLRSRERLDVSWRCKEDAAPRNNTAAPVIGKFVLELSQMKLADSLIKDQDDVFYCVSDTEVI